MTDQRAGLAKQGHTMSNETDVAGLVKRLRWNATCQDCLNDPDERLLTEAATALETLARERDSAVTIAERAEHRANQAESDRDRAEKAEARLAAIESAEMPEDPEWLARFRKSARPDYERCALDYDDLVLHAQKLAADLVALRELDNRTLEEKFAEDVVHTRELAEVVRQRDQAMAQHVKDLAAANERAERMREALEVIAEHYTDTDLAAKHMSAHARMALSGSGDSNDYIWKKDRATLAGESK